MPLFRILGLIVLSQCFTINPLSAQSPYPFGTVSMADMEMTEYEQDKEAEAVYLFDWGQAKINALADKPLTVTKHYRIKILKPQGLDQASIKLTYFSTRIPNLKASTFNLVNGKIEETPVNKKDIYVEKKSANSYTISFAFSNVKMGSVIECSYSLNYGSIFQLYPWAFQHRIPVVKSEYSAIFPGVFRYKNELHQNNLTIKTNTSYRDLYIESIRTQEITQNYFGFNIPAFEPEPYMASVSDQLARVEFELGKIDLPNYSKNVTPTYAELPKELLNDENFGIPLKNTGFLIKKTAEITHGLTSDIDKIRAIHQYITENVKWNEETGINTSFTTLKKVITLQSGSVADINLLLIAMLQKAGVTAHPVVFSTRENGKLNPYYAIMSKFDYVVAYVRTDGKDYLIDATDASRPFNQLPFECLNGNGRIVHEKATDWIALSNKEQLYDQVTLNVTVGANESLEGNVQRIYHSYSAYAIRKEIQSIGQEGYWETLKQIHGNWEYANMQIENLDSIEKPIIIKYNIKTNDAVQQSSNLCLINPVLFFAQNENPFSSSERKFPIDFGFTEDEVYTLNFKIPEGYTIDETPANANIKLPNDAALFIYQTEQKSNQVSIMYRYKRKQTFFEPEAYIGLREFFAKMIKKQSELIILKKVEPPVVSNLN